MPALSDSAVKARLIPEEKVTDAKGWFRNREWDKIGERVLLCPFHADKLGPLSYDLSVGDEAYSIRRGTRIDITKEKELVIEPGETILILTTEYVGLPRTIFGKIDMRARVVFEGILASSTKVDPTWYGKLIIGVTNHSKDSIKLRRGESFCSLILFELSKPCDKILTTDMIPFLGQESIIYQPLHVTPWTPKRSDTVTKEDLDQMVSIFGPPLDIARGMFDLLKKDTRDFVEHEWGPHVLRELEHVATSKAYSYLKWLTSAIIIVLFIAVIGWIMFLGKK